MTVLIIVLIEHRIIENRENFVPLHTGLQRTEDYDQYNII